LSTSEPGGHAASLAADDPVAEACCPLCQGRRLHYAFSFADRRVVRCAECRLVLLNPKPAGADLTDAIDSPEGAGVDPTLGPGEMEANVFDSGHCLGDASARYQLRQLARYRGAKGGSMLIVDAGPGGMACEASSLGFRVTSARAADLSALGLTPGSFDICALTGAIESARDPLALLGAVRRLLMPGGVLLVVTPSLDSLCAGLTQDARLTYFDFHTIQTALHRAGFEQAVVQYSRRPDARLSAHGMADRAFGWARQAVAQMLWGDAPHPGGVLAMARAAAVPACRTLSVVVPAFNEAATVGPLLDALLHKRVTGMRIEVIVVESNSTDGTREVVQKYAAHPRVQVVLEDRPRGKGHAVRTGLAHATGDYVLIQDADLEYDLEDYDVLLEPLAAGREALVLGSRHGGNAWWKMRQFAGQPLASFALNCGHWFFTTLLNSLFGQRLKDPFTMYKVFRRDCIFGLDFKCNRFDFDYELLVKMIRKGYQPIEVPVNYRSRSFKEGKKVSAFRDPFNWLKALAWLRFVSVDPLAEVERRRGLEKHDVETALPVAQPSRAAA
jgi:SAM-dependent methyltransferase